MPSPLTTQTRTQLLAKIRNNLIKKILPLQRLVIRLILSILQRSLVYKPTPGHTNALMYVVRYNL